MIGRFREVHSILYFTGLFLMIVSLPLSRFSLSVAQFILVGNWLLETDFRRKWNEFRKNTPALVLVSLFLLHVIGLIHSSDMTYAMKDLRIKLPLLALPVVFSTTKPIESKKFNILLVSYIGAVMISTLINFGILLFTEVSDVRQISPFISHIRLSLNVCFAIFLSGYYAFNKSGNFGNYRQGFIVAIAWLVIYLIVSQSGTGFYVLAVTTGILVIFGLISMKNRRIKLVTGIIFTGVFVSVGAYLVLTVKNYLHTDKSELRNLPSHTIKGNAYLHDTVNSLIENGSLIGTYVCDKELRESWNQRSRMAYDSLNQGGYKIKATLIRYLNSRGLKKDEAGVKALTEKDIRNIEAGWANVHYAKKISLNAPVYKLLWEYQLMKRGANPGGMSGLQRIEYWKAALGIIGSHFLTGVGTGDMDTAFKTRYRQMNSRLAPEYQHRSHNQFLAVFVAFGVFGFIWFLFTLIYPPVKLGKTHDFKFLVFFIIILLSMVIEDTLETQQGVTLFAFFTSFLLFVHKE
jgi:hypothetical protein